MFGVHSFFPWHLDQMGADNYVNNELTRRSNLMASGNWDIIATQSEATFLWKFIRYFCGFLMCSKQLGYEWSDLSK